MRKLLLGSAAAMAGLLTISCSDEGAGPLGPSFGPEGAADFTGEMRVVLPTSGTRVLASSGLLVAVEQQVRPESGPACGAVEIATEQTDWTTVEEFPWSAQSTDFSVQIDSDVLPGPFRLRVVVRDAESRQIRMASQDVELVNLGLSVHEMAFGEPDRPELPSPRLGWLDEDHGDAHWQRPEEIAEDRPGADNPPIRPVRVAVDRPGDIVRARPEAVAVDRPGEAWRGRPERPID